MHLALNASILGAIELQALPQGVLWSMMTRQELQTFNQNLLLQGTQAESSCIIGWSGPLHAARPQTSPPFLPHLAPSLGSS